MMRDFAATAQGQAGAAAMSASPWTWIPSPAWAAAVQADTARLRRYRDAPLIHVYLYGFGDAA